MIGLAIMAWKACGFRCAIVERPMFYADGRVCHCDRCAAYNTILRRIEAGEFLVKPKWSDLV